MTRKAAAAFLLIAGISPVRAAQVPPPTRVRPALAIDTLLLRDVTRTLADDSLRGRDTGSPGGAAAARYIATRLRELGLRPAAPGGGFTQAVPLVSSAIDPSSTISVAAAVFAHGPDFFVLPGPRAEAKTFDAEALFLGTGENLAPVDAHVAGGRILVVLGPLPEPQDSILTAWAGNGALAVILLFPDEDAYASARRSLSRPLLGLGGDPDPVRAGPPPPVIVAGLRFSRALFAGVALPPPAAGPPPAIPLPARVTAEIHSIHSPVAAVNIVAALPGSDPALRDEFVVYTAHYDHIGTGEPDESGDSIYNGFSDNAAGVAMLIAIADALRHDPPPRSVLFLFLTGEERGLLGSLHAAVEPPWSGGLPGIEALINLDGGAPPVPPVSWRIAGGLAPDGIPTPLGSLADSIAGTRGWTARLENARPNSDYFPFAERGVPAIFIIPGTEWEGTSAEDRDALFKRWDRYHQPGDEYRVEYPFAGIMRYAEFALSIGRAAGGAR